MRSLPSETLCKLPSFGGHSEVHRFSLRKREAARSSREVNLSSYNSAFLSGLFADVAKVQGMESDRDAQDATEKEQVICIQEDNDTEDPRLNPQNSIKRSRISLARSLSKSRRSCRNLADVTAGLGEGMVKEDSLHIQLNAVSEKDELSPKSVVSACHIVFPNLPATVSDSSCAQDLSRLSDRHVSEPESPCKNSYGWFVEMDGDGGNNFGADPYPRNSSSSHLAFTAQTAPVSQDHEAEVEWAKAADTVDDVLGDFF